MTPGRNPARLAYFTDWAKTLPPRPLPRTVIPVAGEDYHSYLARLATRILRTQDPGIVRQIFSSLASVDLLHALDVFCAAKRRGARLCNPTFITIMEFG